jgi:hypothetical protein
MKDVMGLIGDLARMVGREARQAGQDKLPKVKEAVANAVKEVEKIFRG